MAVQKKSNQMPFASENGVSSAPKQYFTADEAMAFMEPRIRALFR